MAGVLVSKLVKPTKVFCSRTSYQIDLNQLLFPQAKPDIGAGAARVLGKANPAVGQELCRLDPTYGVCHQLAKFVALFVGDRGAQVLDFDQSFAHEYDLGDIGDAGHPGVANQLLDRFCQDDRIRIRQPRRSLQIKFTRPVSNTNDFVAYVDAIGVVSRNASCLRLKCADS